MLRMFNLRSGTKYEDDLHTIIDISNDSLRIYRISLHNNIASDCQWSEVMNKVYSGNKSVRWIFLPIPTNSSKAAVKKELTKKKSFSAIFSLLQWQRTKNKKKANNSIKIWYVYKVYFYILFFAIYIGFL